MYGAKSLLKDNSWIKRADDEEEDVDRDPNYGRTLLSRRDSDIISGFSGDPDGVGSSTSSTTVSRDGKTTTTTETTTIKSVRSALKSSRTDTFTERVLSSSKGAQYAPYSPTKTTEVRKTSITSPKDAEDHLYDTLDPSPYQSSYSPTDSKSSVTTTETVTVKNGSEVDAENQLYDRLIPKSIQDEAASGRKPLSSTETVTVRSSSMGGDNDPYPYRGESSTVTSSTSIRSYSSYTDDSPISSSSSYTVSTNHGDSYSRPSSSYEYSSGPSSYTSTSYKTTSRSDDSLSDPLYSKSSIKNVYSSSERTVLEKDLCTTCHKPFTGDAKMVLDDMNINCHATCFRCNVCNNTLGNLKAGDSMWVYRGMVHCQNCFESTKAKWRR